MENKEALESIDQLLVYSEAGTEEFNRCLEQKEFVQFLSDPDGSMPNSLTLNGGFYPAQSWRLLGAR